MGGVISPQVHKNTTAALNFTFLMQIRSYTRKCAVAAKIAVQYPAILPTCGRYIAVQIGGYTAVRLKISGVYLKLNKLMYSMNFSSEPKPYSP